MHHIGVMIILALGMTSCALQVFNQKKTEDEHVKDQEVNTYYAPQNNGSDSSVKHLSVF